MASTRKIELHEPDEFGGVRLEAAYFGSGGVEADEADAVSGHVRHLDPDGEVVATSWVVLSPQVSDR
jgi:hypothetical protein